MVTITHKQNNRALIIYAQTVFYTLQCMFAKAKIEILLRNVYRKAQLQKTIWHASFFFKIGVNIQTLTHLACLLNTNSRPSQGEYLAYGSLLSEASSHNGKAKVLLTYSTENRACVLLKLLKDLTFVTFSVKIPLNMSCTWRPRWAPKCLCPHK